jgi:hypothetical protein
MRLNGWQRLWIVLFVLWTGGVGAVGWQKWPSRLDADAWKFGWQQPVDGHSSWFDFSPRASGEQTITLVAVDHAVPVDQWLPIGAEIPPQYFASRSDAAVQRRLHESRLSAARLVVSLWLVPPMALYLFAWSLGWVRRGFTEGRAQ